VTRADENNNPSAFTTAVAQEAGLRPGFDYVDGTPFPAPSDLVTAKLLHDTVKTTERVIQNIGFYTATGEQRWAYIGMPKFIWDSLSLNQKRDVIGWMYQREGGTAMIPLFPNYGDL